jgi:release factor glutamine methyltransferase
MAEFHPLRSKHDLENDPAWEALNQEAELLAKKEPTAPLPSLDHLTFQDYQNVYEPSDDTYLLLDALQYEFGQGGNDGEEGQCHFYSIAEQQGSFRVLEIGCGSGVPSVFFRMQWRKQQEETETDASTGASKRQRQPARLISLVTDINPRALQVTKETAIKNSSNNSNELDTLEAIQCDLATALLPRLAGQVDVILFNPPYVPTPDTEVGGSGIEASWAGGVHGRRVVDRAVEQIAQLLRRPSGVLYLITVDDNMPVELAGRFREHGLSMKPLFRRRVHNEYLTVQKITWIPEEQSLASS